MSTSLNDFKDNFKGGGTRQNRFKIIGNFPSGGDNSNGGGSNNRISEFHVRSTLIPTCNDFTISVKTYFIISPLSVNIILFRQAKIYSN